MFDWSELPLWSRAMDIALIVLLVILIVIWSIRWKSESKAQETDVHERDLGISTVSRQLSIGLTAASILLPASFVIITLGREVENPLPIAATTQVIIAAIWFTVAIITGFWNASRLPTYISKYNVAMESMTNVLCASQLFLTMFGAGTLLSALFLL